MSGGFAPRFGIEAAFLIVLGVAAGIADLRPAVIVALLAGAWVLVSLIELAVWRSQARALLPFAPHAPPPELEPEPAVEPVVEAVEPDDTAYPLRADAGSPQSEEVEAYTRVLSSEGRPEASEEPEPSHQT
jgi:hypothetical protein